jgi:hypothetical protein
MPANSAASRSIASAQAVAVTPDQSKGFGTDDRNTLAAWSRAKSMSSMH